MSFEMSGKGFGKKNGFSKTGGFAKGNPNDDDPLKVVNYSDSLEVDAAAEIAALQQGFQQRAKKEQERFIQAVDSEFWFAVCFKSRRDKDMFLSNANIHLNFIGNKYLDGYKLAKVLGVAME